MANSKIPSREQLLRGQQTSYTAPRTQAQDSTKLVTAPEDAPAMTAREVQNVVNQNAGQQQAAAQNAATALPVTGAGVTGMGRYGSGQWYNAIGPGGKVTDQAAFLAAAPGAYNSPYAAAMQQNLNQLLNPEGFRYDVNADGLYQQIKDNYIRQGRQAMMDTQGQAAGLTGGYGNSYGAMAGQQAYQESLGSLAGMIPELQQLAWSQYQAEQDARRNNLEALHKLDADEYARWQDEQKAYQEELAKLPAASHQTMLGGGGGPTIVVPGSRAAGTGPVNWDQVSTMAELIGKNLVTPDQLLYANEMGWLDINDATKNVIMGTMVPQQQQAGGTQGTAAQGTGDTSNRPQIDSEEYSRKVNDWNRKQ